MGPAVHPGMARSAAAGLIDAGSEVVATISVTISLFVTVTRQVAFRSDLIRVAFVWKLKRIVFWPLIFRIIFLDLFLTFGN